MFHEVSQRLVTWAATVVGEPIATLGPPTSGTPARRIGLSLVDVIPLFAPAAEATPFEVALRYLATVSAETPIDSHRLLGQLTFAAMAEPDIMLDPDRPTMQFWLAQGMAPQPCVVLRVIATKERAAGAIAGSAQHIERRQTPPRPQPRNGCAFQRRASDWRPAPAQGRELTHQISAWRERC